MPRKTARKTAAKRRVVRKKKPSTWTKLYKMPVGKSPVQFIRLRYAEEITIDAAANALNSYVFSATNLYDPNTTGIGHQPLGFDQMMAKYDHFVVMYARITVRYMPVGVTNVIAPYVHILRSDGGAETSNYTDVVHWLETNPGVKQLGVLYSGGGANNPINALHKSYDARKQWKVKNPAALDKLIGSDASGPSDNTYFEVTVGSVQGNNPDPIPLLVTIDYWAQFIEPKLIAQS